MAKEDCARAQDVQQASLYVGEGGGNGVEHLLCDAGKAGHVVDDGLVGLDKLVEDGLPVPGDQADPRERVLVLPRHAHLAVKGQHFTTSSDTALLNLGLGNVAVLECSDAGMDPALGVFEAIPLGARLEKGGVLREAVFHQLLGRGQELGDACPHVGPAVGIGDWLGVGLLLLERGCEHGLHGGVQLRIFVVARCPDGPEMREHVGEWLQSAGQGIFVEGARVVVIRGGGDAVEGLIGGQVGVGGEVDRLLEHGLLQAGDHDGDDLPELGAVLN